MAYTQQLCACGGTSFFVLPEIHIHFGPTVHSAHNWTVTAVVCTQCTRTEMFTNNADQVARHVPNARTIVAGPQ